MLKTKVYNLSQRNRLNIIFGRLLAPRLVKAVSDYDV